MIVSEETARRIADELKRLADILDRQQPIMPSYPQRYPLVEDPNRCWNCGGYHGNNMPCPRLAPTSCGMIWRDREMARMELGWHRAFLWTPEWLSDIERWAWLETVYRKRERAPYSGWPIPEFQWKYRATVQSARLAQQGEGER